MAPFASLFRAAAAAVREPSAQPAQATAAAPQETTAWDDSPDWDDTAWGFYDSSAALRQGLEVMEHAAPAALVGLLQDVSRHRAATVPA